MNTYRYIHACDINIIIFCEFTQQYNYLGIFFFRLELRKLPILNSLKTVGVELLIIILFYNIIITIIIIILT